MSQIRRQSLFSSFIIYFGFGIGLINTYFFTREGYFEKAEYGLTTVFLAIAVLMSSLSALGMPSYIYKFFPYYKDYVPSRKNDMLTWALIGGIAGFLLVAAGGLILKDLVVKKFGTNSPLLVAYYSWVFPLGFGLTVYSILEAYAWSIGKSVVTNFLREVCWRLCISALITLFVLRVIPDFDVFIKLFAFSYPCIAMALLIYLFTIRQISFSFTPSMVTRRFFKKIVSLCFFFYTATLIQALSKVFDSFVIASKLENGLDKAGIYALATLMSTVMQAPQRGVVSASVSHISRAWKEKDIPLIQKIYQRSSINLLLFASAVFCLILLNASDAIQTFSLKPDYLEAIPVFVILGLSVIVDMGTGVNGQIIGTSVYWRFELYSGIILVSCMLPLTYLFTVYFGLIGPAYATLLSLILYNSLRIVFLWVRFRLFPFQMNTLYALALAGFCYIICLLLFRRLQGIDAIIIRSVFFIILYGGGVYFLRLSPDVYPVLQSLRKRMNG
ncbi:MAG: lipopolysaccharide biosynthesis protein [Chitinophagaceae bacterium]|nr:lipopolysaccharide biosynthesis protein [Chitinophagaceae bacterium]